MNCCIFHIIEKFSRLSVLLLQFCNNLQTNHKQNKSILHEIKGGDRTMKREKKPVKERVNTVLDRHPMARHMIDDKEFRSMRIALIGFIMNVICIFSSMKMKRKWQVPYLP